MGALDGAGVAIVHDWLVGQGGGERVLLDFHAMFPDAPIYTLVYDPDRAPGWLRSCDVRTTWLQRVPGAASHHKLALPLMPRAWEALDLTGYDLVLSSCSSCCKGVVTRPDAAHVCYCHTPMRYAWDLYHEYLRSAGPVRGAFMRALVHGVRMWDFQAAQRVDRFVANSAYVARRVAKYYRRGAEVVHPAPAPLGAGPAEAGGYYLVVSRFVPYKRVDLAIGACNALGRRLVVAGSGGEEEGRLRAMAGPTVEFRGAVGDDELAGLYARADALLFPGVEDFGLTPVEAMSAGCPVVAYGAGGALESVEGGLTGLFFGEQSAGSLAGCIERLERGGLALSRAAIAARARERFSGGAFRARMLEICGEALDDARR